jgi:hypothetical protein
MKERGLDLLQVPENEAHPAAACLFHGFGDRSRLATDPTPPRGVRVRLWFLLDHLVLPIDLVPSRDSTPASDALQVT